MRHSKKRLQLNRFTSWHESTIKSLARSILIYQSIKTTRSKAKAARSLVEKLISLAKTNTLAAKRKAFSILQDHKLVSLLFKDIGPRFNNRVGGYIRIMNLGKRRGDDADLVVFELTEKKIKEIKKKLSKKAEQGEVKEVSQAEKTNVEKPVSAEEKKPKQTEEVVKERPPMEKKSPKKFLGGLRNIFKKEKGPM